MSIPKNLRSYVCYYLVSSSRGSCLNLNVIYAGGDLFLVRSSNHYDPVRIYFEPFFYRRSNSRQWGWGCNILSKNFTGFFSCRSTHTYVKSFIQSRDFLDTFEKALKAAFCPPSSQKTVQASTNSSNGVQTFPASTENNSQDEPKSSKVKCSGCGSEVTPGNCGTCTRRFLNAENPKRMLSSRVKTEYDQLKNNPPEVGRDLIDQRIKAIESSGKLT